MRKEICQRFDGEDILFENVFRIDATVKRIEYLISNSFHNIESIILIFN
jgi:hypothetical protein